MFLSGGNNQQKNTLGIWGTESKEGDVKYEDRLYRPVHERIMAIVRLCQKKKYRLSIKTTEPKYLGENQRFVLSGAHVILRDKRGHILFETTGWAHEDVYSSEINKTSHTENAETSAVGRALGFMAFGIEHSFASSDEVDNAIKRGDAQMKLKDLQEKIDKFPPVLLDKLRVLGLNRIKIIELGSRLSWDLEEIEKIVDKKLKQVGNVA